MQFLNPDPLNPDQESLDAKVRASLFSVFDHFLDLIMYSGI